MKNPKRLSAAVVLTLVLSLSVFAGDVSTPPSAPPVPGDVSTPPCGAQMPLDDPKVSGEVDTIFASNTVDILSIVDVAMNLLQIF